MNVDPQLENELAPYLDKDEKLIWTGKPKAGILFFLGDLFLIPFSLLWGGTAIWGACVAIYHLEVGLIIAFIPFLMAAWFIMIGRFYWDARRRANITYGLTHDNVIIRSGIFSKGVQVYKIQNLTGITLSIGRKGTGSISLGPTHSRSTRWLMLIENPQEVYDKIMHLKTVWWYE